MFNSKFALDEGSLTGKYDAEHVFAEDDFRHRYFGGDRMQRTTERVEQIRDDLERFGLDGQYTLADVALKFALARPEVSTVIAGMRNSEQAKLNTRTSDLKDLPETLLVQLRRHNWHRGVWYG